MAIPTVHIDLAVSGHSDVNMVDHGRVGQRTLCRGQTDLKNARMSQTDDRKDRWPVGRGDR